MRTMTGSPISSFLNVSSPRIRSRKRVSPSGTLSLTANSVRPRGGGTLILAGSPRLLIQQEQALPAAGRGGSIAAQRDRFARSHPWLRALTGLASSVGLDAAEAAQVLADGTYADAVREDEAQASALGISGVPFTVLDNRYAVSGAQPAEAFAAALDRAWSESKSRA